MITFLTRVAGFAKAEQAGVWKASASIDEVNKAVAAGGKNFVYAGTTATPQLVQAKSSALLGEPTPVFNNPPQPLVSYFGRPEPRPTHWVVVSAAITDTGTHYRVPVWSWATSFTVEIAHEHFDSYVYRWLVGRVA
jgi:hypothetical protein